MQNFYYSVALPTPLRQLFTYHSSTKIAPGSRVAVSFNRRNLVGFIIKSCPKPNFKTIEIKEILDKEPTFDNESFQTLIWIANYYHHSIGEVLNNFLPPKLRKINFVLEKIANSETNTQVIKGSKTYDLTPDQKNVISQIQQSKGFDPTILHGVTSSGKTEVYLQLTEKFLKQDTSIMILVPEISLTPQIYERFRSRFKGNIGLYHSKRTDKERFECWQDCKSGNTRILIGTRSSLFLPLQKLGLIILDEEHDPSFKQHEGVRFSSKNVALKIAQDRDIPIVLSSATPSLQALELVDSKNYKFLSMPTRINGDLPPSFILHDTRTATKKAGIDISLFPIIQKTIDRGKKVLIFLNQRGFAPLLSCNACSWSALCKNCSVKLVFHKEDNILLCHKCQKKYEVPKKCPQCASGKFHYYGVGTEQIESELKNEFKEIPLIRFDLDTTKKKGSLEDVLKKISDSNSAILVGTQMIAKGHDFSEVELGIILNCDQGLISHEPNAIEKLSQLLIQVIGRVGRSGTSKVIIQTDYPDDKNLNALKEGNYLRFSKYLLGEYKRLKLPPYVSIALIRTKSKDLNASMSFLRDIRSSVEASTNAHCIGPLPAPLNKIKNLYRNYLLIKDKDLIETHKTISKINAAIGKTIEDKKIQWSIDLNPSDYS